MRFLVSHYPILQVIIPFFGAVISAITFNKTISRLIAIFSVAASFIISCYIFSTHNIPFSYFPGSWAAPFGIEYRIDILNLPIIIFINFILLVLLVFGRQIIELTVIRYIEVDKQHIFYSLLLFAHTGYLGVLSTNDLFNCYVFIEISSLATYVLMSKGKSPAASVGALDYLVMGTIGATLILISIGFLLALTGSLNISDIAVILGRREMSKIAVTAIVFFLSGSMLKMAFFPTHFWMIRAYRAAPPYMLTYLAAISSIMGIYMILRFLHFAVDAYFIAHILWSVIQPIAIITIIIATFLALRSNNFKDIVIYSTASQIGYIFLLLCILPARHLLWQLLLLDALNKMALFTIIAHLQLAGADINFTNFPKISNSNFFKLLVALSLIFSSSLPITSMFIVKVQILDLLIKQSVYGSFWAVIIGSVVSLLYHFKLAGCIFFGKKAACEVRINSNLHGLVFIVIAQILSLVFFNKLTAIATEVGHTVIQTSNLKSGTEEL